MVQVESALDAGQTSRAGCTGPWQFTPTTAAYDLGPSKVKQAIRHVTDPMWAAGP